MLKLADERNVRRSKADPRTEATRAALIETAESLFARDGIDAVSLRDIGAAIGSANSNVVGYHFGGRDDLLLAIFRHRLLPIDARRSELLDRAMKASLDGDLSTLLDALWRPLLEQTDANGRRSYAAFLDRIFRSDRLHLRTLVAEDFVVASALSLSIAKACGRALDAAFQTELHIGFAMVTATLHIIDAEQCTKDQAEARFARTITMLTGALAPATSNKRK